MLILTWFTHTKQQDVPLQRKDDKVEDQSEIQNDFIADKNKFIIHDSKLQGEII